MMESRQFDRYNCTHPVWLRLSNQNDDAFQLGEAQNISQGGAYVITYGDIRVGQELYLVLEVPEEWGLLSVLAPVRHVQKVGLISYCGVSFEDFGGLERDDFAQTMIGGLRRKERRKQIWQIDPLDPMVPTHLFGRTGISG